MEKILYYIYLRNFIKFFLLFSFKYKMQIIIKKFFQFN
jgi:hypothetical protein